MGAAALFNWPLGIAVNASTGNVFVGDLLYGTSSTLRQIDTNGGALVAGGVVSTVPLGTLPVDIASAIVNDPESGLMYLGGGSQLARINNGLTSFTVVAGSATIGTVDGTGAAATLAGVEAITIAPSSRVIYFASSNAVNAGMMGILGCRVRAFNIITGAVTTLAGGASGAGTECTFADSASGATARFSGIRGITWHPSNGNLYVGGSGDNRIRVVSTTPPYATSTLAGSGAAASVDGMGALASLNDPRGIVVDPIMGGLYVGENGDGGIRTVSLSGEVGTLAGSAAYGASTNDGPCATAGVAGAMQIAITADGGRIFVGAQNSNRVRVVLLATPSPQPLATASSSGSATATGAVLTLTASATSSGATSATASALGSATASAAATASATSSSWLGTPFSFTTSVLVSYVDVLADPSAFSRVYIDEFKVGLSSCPPTVLKTNQTMFDWGQPGVDCGTSGTCLTVPSGDLNVGHLTLSHDRCYVSLGGLQAPHGDSFASGSCTGAGVGGVAAGASYSCTSGTAAAGAYTYAHAYGLLTQSGGKILAKNDPYTTLTCFEGTGSITGTTLTITVVTSGVLKVGSIIVSYGTALGTNTIAAGTSITVLVTGTGGVGTYTVSSSQAVASVTISSLCSTSAQASSAAQVPRSVAVGLGYNPYVSAADTMLWFATGETGSGKPSLFNMLFSSTTSPTPCSGLNLAGGARNPLCKLDSVLNGGTAPDYFGIGTTGLCFATDAGAAGPEENGNPFYQHLLSVWPNSSAAIRFWGDGVLGRFANVPYAVDSATLASAPELSKSIALGCTTCELATAYDPILYPTPPRLDTTSFNDLTTRFSDAPIRCEVASSGFNGGSTLGAVSAPSAMRNCAAFMPSVTTSTYRSSVFWAQYGVSGGAAVQRSRYSNYFWSSAENLWPTVGATGADVNVLSVALDGAQMVLYAVTRTALFLSTNPMDLAVMVQWTRVYFITGGEHELRGVAVVPRNCSVPGAP